MICIFLLCLLLYTSLPQKGSQTLASLRFFRAYIDKKQCTKRKKKSLIWYSCFVVCCSNNNVPCAFPQYILEQQFSLDRLWMDPQSWYERTVMHLLSCEHYTTLVWPLSRYRWLRFVLFVQLNVWSIPEISSHSQAIPQYHPSRYLVSEIHPFSIPRGYPS